MDPATGLLALTVLVAVGCLGAESALTHLPLDRLEALAHKSGAGARLVTHLERQPRRRHLSLVLVLFAAAAGSFSLLLRAGGVLPGSAGSVWWLGVGAPALALLLYASWLMGRRFPEPLAVRTAGLVIGLTYALWPVVSLCLVLHRFGERIALGAGRPALTNGPLRTMLEQGANGAPIDSQERELIHNVFEFAQIETREIMTPRVDMFCLDCNATIRETLDAITREMYSRIPVYNELVDKIEGIVFTKDLLPLVQRGELDVPLRNVMKPALFVTVNQTVDSLLRLFREQKVHLAMVVDEYGGIQGLITIEDVLEQLVGEIYDEKDKPERPFHRVDARVYRVLGWANLEDVNGELRLHLEEDEAYETISGYILAKLGHLPAAGEVLDLEEVTIRVDKLEHYRIQEVTITRK